MLELTLRPVINCSVIWRCIEGEIVTITPDSNWTESPDVRILNETGSRVWELINGEKNIGEIVKSLCLKFKVRYQDALPDTIDFLLYLKDRKMIELKDAT